jgi:hypothetical protein
MKSAGLAAVGGTASVLSFASILMALCLAVQGESLARVSTRNGMMPSFSAPNDPAMQGDCDELCHTEGAAQEVDIVPMAVAKGRYQATWVDGFPES